MLWQVFCYLTAQLRIACKLFLRQNLHTRLDLLLPNCEETVSKQQADQKTGHGKHSHLCELTVGAVMPKNNKQGMPFVPGVVKKKLGPLTYLIETQNGLIWTRHIDYLKSLGHNNLDNPLMTKLFTLSG